MIKIFIYKSCLSVYMRKRVGRQCRKRFHFCIFSVCVCDVDLIRYIFNNFSHNTKTDLSTGDIELKARGKKNVDGKLQQENMHTHPHRQTLLNNAHDCNE